MRWTKICKLEYFLLTALVVSAVSSLVMLETYLMPIGILLALIGVALGLRVSEKETENVLIISVFFLSMAVFNKWGFLYGFGLGLDTIMNEFFVKTALFAGFAAATIWLKTMYFELNELSGKIFSIEKKLAGAFFLAVALIISLWDASLDLLARPSGKIGVAIALLGVLNGLILIESKNRRLLILAVIGLILAGFTQGFEYLDSFYGAGHFIEEFFDKMSWFAALTAVVLVCKEIFK